MKELGPWPCVLQKAIPVQTRNGMVDVIIVEVTFKRKH